MTNQLYWNRTKMITAGWAGSAVLLVVGILVSCALVHADTSDEAVVELIMREAMSLRGAAGLAPLLEQAGDKRFVLLGEASHGTAEFYTWRAEISQGLIKDHGFSFIAVEGDWDACMEVNAYVKHFPGAADTAEEALGAFDRWPPWMWGNREVERLIEWMRAYNADRAEADRVGFYGIDVYGLEGSLREVVAYLEAIDDGAARTAREAYACLEPFAATPQRYAQAVMSGVADCTSGAEAVVELFRAEADVLRAHDSNAYFKAKQHALVVKSAERHYREMTLPGGESWNTRVAHFHLTVERLMDHHGADARGIVWAHNTHIGDARATPMAEADRRNIGQLLREAHGDDAVFAVGFGTHRGVVLAGRAWGDTMQRMTVPHAMPGSWEDLMNRAGINPALLLLTPEHRDGPLARSLGHRAIGVVYNPERERFGNYVPTVLPLRYDAFIFIEETTPLTPIRE